MSVFAFARRGARVAVCVLALGAASASAQQVPGEEPVENSTAPSSETDQGDNAVNAAETAGSPESEEGKALPELVVDGPADKKEEKKKAKTQDVITSGGYSSSIPVAEPIPGVVYGTTADTGMTTFDADSVTVRTDGSGDANTFLRNLPNVQYQNQATGNGGTSVNKVIDTKPELVSIAGARTYENNFILNGVSITNITGPVQTTQSELPDSSEIIGYYNVYGTSPQNIYVPSEFVGQATVIDSNASAEYGQFTGGVVMYDLAAPPTDRYHASVTASRETSDWAGYVLGTDDGKNPNNRKAPTYTKTNLSASVGAPITPDFAFIGQISRKEADAEKDKVPQLVGNGRAAADSTNTFMRFGATARTDLGKFTFDTARTDYFQHWENIYSNDAYIDTNTVGTTTKLDHEAKLTGVGVPEIGLGGMKIENRAFYNTNETENNSSGNTSFYWAAQRLTNRGANVLYDTSDIDDWCPGVDPANYTYPVSASSYTVRCYSGGYGDTLQGQTDFGAQTKLSGDVLLGTFKAGAEFKRYVGERARQQESTQVQETYVIAADGNIYTSSSDAPVGLAPASGEFDCTGDALCTPEQRARSWTIYPKYDVTASVNAVHTYLEFDQSYLWFNVRAGARLDYDDYFKNYNLAPRLAGTFTPFDWLSVTGGYNRYYLGETLYYAVRDKTPLSTGYGLGTDFTTVTPSAGPNRKYDYTFDGLATPYSDEYTGTVRIREPLFNGQFRFKYLERYGKDQFSTGTSGLVLPYAKISNDGTTFYRSASAEYTKAWGNLQTPINLNAAAITGNVTWSEQQRSSESYLYSDNNGDGSSDFKIIYNGKVYDPGEFGVITGNLDIPVRFGATLTTVWFDDLLELNVNAGVNLGYKGVAYRGVTFNFACGGLCDVYEDKSFGATLKLDVSGRINVTQEAAIDFHIDNLLNSDLNTVANADTPWVLGRTIWVGSSLRF